MLAYGMRCRVTCWEVGVDLPDGAKAAKEVEQLFRRDSKGQVLAEQRSIHFRRELFLGQPLPRGQY